MAATDVRPQRCGHRGVASTERDGQALVGSDVAIPLADDGATHHVRVIMGGSARSAQRDPGPAMPMLANDGVKKETDR